MSRNTDPNIPKDIASDAVFAAAKARLRKKRIGSIGVGGVQLPGDESDQRGDPETGCAGDLGAEPAGAVAAHERPDDPEQSGAGEADAGQVDVLVGSVALGELGAGEGEREQPDRDVEPEDPLPADALGDGAADERSDRDREALDPAPGAECGAALLGWDGAGEDGQGERGDDRAADSLEGAGGDQLAGWTGRARRRPTRAVKMPMPATNMRRRPKRSPSAAPRCSSRTARSNQRVAVDGPLEAAVASPSAQLLLDHGAGRSVTTRLSRAVMKIDDRAAVTAHPHGVYRHEGCCMGTQTAVYLRLPGDQYRPLPGRDRSRSSPAWMHCILCRRRTVEAMSTGPGHRRADRRRRGDRRRLDARRVRGGAQHEHPVLLRTATTASRDCPAMAGEHLSGFGGSRYRRYRGSHELHLANQTGPTKVVTPANLQRWSARVLPWH